MVPLVTWTGKTPLTKNQFRKETFDPFYSATTTLPAAAPCFFFFSTSPCKMPCHKTHSVTNWIIPDVLILVPSSVPWKSLHLHRHCQQMESGKPLTSRVHGWREGRPEVAGTLCLTGRTPASRLLCVMSQRRRQELMSWLPCTRVALTLTCTLLASTFIRSAKRGGEHKCCLHLWAVCLCRFPAVVFNVISMSERFKIWPCQWQHPSLKVLKLIEKQWIYFLLPI